MHAESSFQIADASQLARLSGGHIHLQIGRFDPSPMQPFDTSIGCQILNRKNLSHNGDPQSQPEFALVNNFPIFVALSRNSLFHDSKGVELV